MVSLAPTAPAPHRRLRIAMGTWVAIETSAPSAKLAHAALEAAFEAITDIERWMHPQRTGSDIARINQSLLGTRIEIQAATHHVLTLAQNFNRYSGGVFDPCLPVKPGRISDIELSDDGSVVCRKSVALDLGGIAKGYAVDRAIEVLVAQGCTSGLVNAGGDLRIFGTQRETLLLRKADGGFQPLQLHNAALAVSDGQCAQRPAEHQGYYLRGEHKPLQRHYAAVKARDATTADALVKCALLCTGPVAQRVLRECGAQSAVPCSWES